MANEWWFPTNPPKPVPRRRRRIRSFAETMPGGFGGGPLPPGLSQAFKPVLPATYPGAFGGGPVQPGREQILYELLRGGYGFRK